jgi:hypothetical protein
MRSDVTRGIHNLTMDNGLIGALIGGAVTCVAAYLTLRHDGKLAREQLLQNRFAPAYLALQLYISTWADHAQWHVNSVKLSPNEPPLPDLSDVEIAQVSLFASDAVMTATNQFGDAIRAYRFAIVNLEIVQQMQGLGDSAVVADLRSTIDQRDSAARHLVATAVAVHQKLRKELPVSPWRLLRARQPPN